MPPQEISYWPSRAKQTIFLAILLLVFLVCAAGLLVLWPIDPANIQDMVWRTLLVNFRVLALVLLAVLAVFSAVSLPILLFLVLLPSPALVLTPTGMRLGKVQLRWEEIDEVHEYVHGGALQQTLIGLYLRDEEAACQHLSFAARFQLRNNKKHGLPPIVVATHHLRESVEEIMDDIEAYLEALSSEKGKRRKLPTVYRRKE